MKDFREDKNNLPEDGKNSFHENTNVPRRGNFFVPLVVVAVILLVVFWALYALGVRGFELLFLYSIAAPVAVAGISSLLLSFIAWLCLRCFSARIPFREIQRWAGYTFPILVLVVVWKVLTLSSDGGPPNSAVASNIISDLRTMKATALMFYEESRDFIPEVSKGFNVCKYLIRYMDNPSKFSDDRYIFIISGDHWWSGYNLGSARTMIYGAKTKDVKEKLADRASGVGLFGSSKLEPPVSTDEAHQYKESDTFVWMFVPTPREKSE